MPIVIDEVEISIVAPAVSQNVEGAAGTASAEELVKICVEKVLEILNQKLER